MPPLAALSGGVRHLGSRVIILGIVLALLGVLSIAAPLQSAMAIAVVVGVLLVVGGVIRTVFAIVAATWGSAILRFLFGVLMVVCGVWVVTNPEAGVKVLTLVLAAYFVADGIFQIIFSLQLRPVGGGVWVMLSGILGVVLGVLIWVQWPLSGEWAIGVLVGVKLILDGGSLIGLGFAGRSLAGALE
jgi:uncharacterized membrane protein HdeD (DUF308 family)